MRQFSEEHKRKLKDKAKGRKVSAKTLAKFKEMLANNHPKIKEWLLVDPQENLHIIDNLAAFCLERNLCYSSFRYKARVNDGSTFNRGKNKGWAYFASRKKGA